MCLVFWCTSVPVLNNLPTVELHNFATQFGILITDCNFKKLILHNIPAICNTKNPADLIV